MKVSSRESFTEMSETDEDDQEAYEASTLPYR